jgi:hypothetical protein
MRRLPAPQQLPPPPTLPFGFPLALFRFFHLQKRGGGNWTSSVEKSLRNDRFRKIKPKRDLHLKGLTPFFSSDFSTRGEKKGNKNFVCRDNTLPPPQTLNRGKRETLVRRTFFIRSVFLGDVHTFFSYLISRARLIATSYRLWPSNAEPLPSFLCSFRKRFQEDTSGTLLFFSIPREKADGSSLVSKFFFSLF